DHAEQFAILAERYRDIAARPALLDKGAPTGIARQNSFVFAQIDMDDILSARDAGSWTMRRRVGRCLCQRLDEIGRHAVQGRCMELRAVKGIHDAEGGLTEPHRLFEHRGQYRRELAWP